MLRVQSTSIGIIWCRLCRYVKLYARQIARCCMAIWRKIPSTDKNNAGKFAKNLPSRCDITHKQHGSGNRIKVYRQSRRRVDALRNHLHTPGGAYHAPSQLLNIYFETL